MAKIARDGALGRAPTRSDTRALMFAKFVAPPAKIPLKSAFWKKRAPFPNRSFGNLQIGCCTRAKQAVASLRMERIETRSTATITDAEIERVYYAMTGRLYGGGDTGAYETDALSEWRKPELTFTDTKARTLTIDAYLRLNPWDHDELRAAMWTAGAHGIAICLNLPLGFQGEGGTWDCPDGALTGIWTPGSWGGHSMWAFEYEERGIWLDHTWERPPQLLTWRAAARYLDEAHLVIDSMDYWRKKKPVAKKAIDFAGITKAVNAVSSQKLAA